MWCAINCLKRLVSIWDVSEVSQTVYYVKLNMLQFTRIVKMKTAKQYRAAKLYRGAGICGEVWTADVTSATETASELGTCVLADPGQTSDTNSVTRQLQQFHSPTGKINNVAKKLITTKFKRNF